MLVVTVALIVDPLQQYFMSSAGQDPYFWYIVLESSLAGLTRISWSLNKMASTV